MRPKSCDELSVLLDLSSISLFSRYSSTVVRSDLAMREYCMACPSVSPKYSRAEIEVRQYFSMIRPKPPSNPRPRTSEDAKSHDLAGFSFPVPAMRLDGYSHYYR